MYPHLKYTVDNLIPAIIPYQKDDELVTDFKCFGNFLAAKTYLIEYLEKRIEEIKKLSQKEIT